MTDLFLMKMSNRLYLSEFSNFCQSFFKYLKSAFIGLISFTTSLLLVVLCNTTFICIRSHLVNIGSVMGDIDVKSVVDIEDEDRKGSLV